MVKRRDHEFILGLVQKFTIFHVNHASCQINILEQFHTKEELSNILRLNYLWLYVFPAFESKVSKLSTALCFSCLWKYSK